MKVFYGRGVETDLDTLLDSTLGQGWHQPVRDLVKDLYDLGWDGVLFQIKEKFGGLRFYSGAVTGEMQDRIQQAEEICYKTCEQCGSPGEPRALIWVQTLCEAHYAEAKQKEKSW